LGLIFACWREREKKKKKGKEGPYENPYKEWIFVKKIIPKLPYREENKFLDSPYLDNRLQTVCQNIVIWLYFCIYLYSPPICHIYSDSGIIFLFGEGN
jgi:hypothetical protein